MSAQTRVAVAAAFLVVVSACASTNPLEGASIEYRMPRTDAVAKLTITMNACDEAKIGVAAELSVSAKPGVDTSKWYRVNGMDLASFRVKRSMLINVSEDGVISAVNTTNTDQTAEIVASIGKLATTVAGIIPLFRAKSLARVADPSGPTCKADFPAAAAALLRAQAVETSIEAARKDVASLPPEEVEKRAKITKRVNYLVTELIAIRQSLLRVETQWDIELKDGELPAQATPATLLPDGESFEKWFGPSVSEAQRKERVARHFKVSWYADELTSVPIEGFNPNDPKNTEGFQALSFDGSDRKSKPDDCDLGLYVPKITRARVTLAGIGDSLINAKLNVSKDLPAAQLSSAAKVCLDVAFGESRTVGLKFDKFGRTTEFNWTSEATGAAIAGSLAASAESASGIYTSLRGPSDLDKQKKQIDELETQQKLNTLLACKAIIEAGGFKCEEEKGDGE